MANKKRKRLPPDYRHVLLGMTLGEIERMDEATQKILREKAQKSAKASRNVRRITVTPK